MGLKCQVKHCFYSLFCYGIIDFFFQSGAKSIRKHGKIVKHEIFGKNYDPGLLLYLNRHLISGTLFIPIYVISLQCQGKT